MAVDIAPLIDIVFILLIFFLVTTTFVKQTGIEVERPRASHAEALTPRSLRISIAPGGAIYTEGQQVSLRQLRQRVGRFLETEAEGSVIVLPDRRVPSGRLVEVMDAAKAAGAQDVAVAAERPSAGGTGGGGGGG
jgi:biopolymer transport protein ExbD